MSTLRQENKVILPSNNGVLEPGPSDMETLNLPRRKEGERKEGREAGKGSFVRVLLRDDRMNAFGVTQKLTPCVGTGGEGGWKHGGSFLNFRGRNGRVAGPSPREGAPPRSTAPCC